MDIGIIRGVITLTILVLFLGIWAWSFNRRRHVEFDEASRLPLGDDARPLAKNKLKEQRR